MPFMRKAILEDHLRRKARFGNTIYILITRNTYRFLLRYRRQSGRTYHDLLKVVIATYRKRPDFFNGSTSRGRWVVNFRLSRIEASWCLNKAWFEGTSRARFLGSLLDVFVSKVPKNEIIRALTDQKDRILRLTGGLNGGCQKNG